MKTVRVEDAVGMVLCHDITKIVPGEFKGRAFKKGHIISSEDIPVLLSLGKDHIYVWEMEEGKVHENEAGIRLAQAVKGPGVSLTEPSEGKVQLVADYDGMCSINEELLLQVNMIDDLVVATRSNNRPVKKGDVVAGVRVIPLVIEDEKLKQAEEIAGSRNVISVLPFRRYQVGVVITGNEVYHRRIEDRFSPVIRKKVEDYGSKVIDQIIVPDDIDRIAAAIRNLIARGANLIVTSGGMSVDPDDVTPSGIRKTGAEIISYGAPVLPGAMILVAYLGDIPVLGLPGCVMYHKTTIFDLLLPIVMSGQKINRSLMARLGLGGLCLHCDVCRYPACSFGTGF
ncbi:MAG: molybdopterin-binding protein [Firmicutes bacterium]|nr:molybdopterin-binding protein [Bacillota bacterium]